MEVKEDCFAYDSKYKQCTALNDLYCKNENCRFYKNKCQMTQAHIIASIRSYADTHGQKKK